MKKIFLVTIIMNYLSRFCLKRGHIMKIDPVMSTYHWFSAESMLWEEMKKTAYIQLPCYQGREASGVWDIKLQAQARENGLCLNELNVSPTKPAQTGGGFMDNPLQGTSEQVSVGCWINSDELQAVPQAKSIFLRVPPVYPVCACYQTQTEKKKRMTLSPLHFQLRLQRNRQYYPRKIKIKGKKTNIHSHQIIFIFFSTLYIHR